MWGIWSYGAGCTLVGRACSTDTPLKGLKWCNESATTQTCVYDRTSVGFCNIGFVGKELPPYFQYFLGNSSLGGLVPLRDYCPIVVHYVDRHCHDPSLPSKDDAIYGLYYRPQSRCVPTRNTVHFGYHTNSASSRYLRVCCRWGTHIKVLVGNLWISCLSNWQCRSDFHFTLQQLRWRDILRTRRIGLFTRNIL
ncbi:surface protease GP63 [Trypanosoma rangeli]|uniref:Leishmanolysin-like peptidase n=1 Tax=Trypanosoma rangeli TaxID=5698 RepID=A0A3R7KHC2_TRYRA|nr:surface protease GP63 [Trypanosoma rangeli]RNF06500.1 surface protease GP63 [Trypanosoma rangeli]|eukprot:RNF06500.1 surface protease GP63 [Trypanosoma rangeli]